MSDQLPQTRTPYAISDARFSVSAQMVTTAFELPGFRVRQNLGIVRGIVVRSRNLFINIGAVFNQMVGGNITAWTSLCEQTRREAFDIMVQHATELGANAIIGARYDATELATGVTEVLAYGTAVVVDPLEGAGIYNS
ncbi:MAG: YbjQ family protein [Pyrinomonadaceae bacterium]